MFKNTSYGNGLVVTFKRFSCICIWQDRILVVASSKASSLFTRRQHSSVLKASCWRQNRLSAKDFHYCLSGHYWLWTKVLMTLLSWPSWNLVLLSTQGSAASDWLKSSCTDGHCHWLRSRHSVQQSRSEKNRSDQIYWTTYKAGLKCYS